MHINTSNAASSIIQAREITPYSPTESNRSFHEVLKEVNIAPAANEKPSILATPVETKIMHQPDGDSLPLDEEPESPPLPEMNTQARKRFDKLLADIAENPEWAERWMHMHIADAQDRPLFTLSCHPPRFVDSGEIYTEEKQDYLFHIASLYEEGRKNLYEAELAKGTPLLEIVEKIFRYNCTMPEDFRRMTGW